MPIKKKPQITAWSHSRKKDYDSCPALARYKHVDGKKTPGSAAMDRGSRIHKEAEHYSTGVLKKRPESLDRFPDEFADLRKVRKKLEVEQLLACNSNWIETGWYDADTWLRVKMDVYYPKDRGKTLRLIDHKTGKIRPADEVQLRLYAAIGAALFPGVENFETELWYLDHGEIVGEVYSRKEALDFQKFFTRETLPMLKDRTFKPTPGRACDWCHFSKSNSGPCRF